jgi:hypothetical protein
LRPVEIALVGALVTSFLSSCGFGGSVDPGFYPYSILNDSSAQIVVDVRGAVHDTFVVPPHKYGVLFEGSVPWESGWTVAIVDGQCVALQTWSLDATRNLVYVGPTGDRELTYDLAGSHGLKTAQSMDLVQRVPKCP